MNWPRISSGTIRVSIGFGASGIQLLKYLTGPFQRMPSKWVKTKVINASASVTDSGRRGGVDPEGRDAVPLLAEAAAG